MEVKKAEFIKSAVKPKDYPPTKAVKVVDKLHALVPAKAKTLEGNRFEDDKQTLHGPYMHTSKTPAAVRMVSYEPALGPVDFRPWLQRDRCTSRGPQPDLLRCGLWRGHAPEPHSALIPTGAPWFDQGALHWIICGGESGPAARSTPIAWLRQAVQQCQSADVPCFVKQLGRRPFWDGYGHLGAEHLHTQPGMLDGVDGYFLDCYRHREGANIDEWPEDLRVQEWPDDAAQFEGPRKATHGEH
jgi:hypothetical protein